MVFVKTQAGQEALKDRHGGLSSRQRSAFILFDGKRTLSEVLAATAAMGITQDDVQTMIAQGLLAPAGGASLPPAADQGGAGVTPPAAQFASKAHGFQCASIDARSKALAEVVVARWPIVVPVAEQVPEVGGESASDASEAMAV